MTTRQDYITAIGTLVGGELPLGEAEKIAAISLAIKEHSRHRPLVVTEDKSGDGGFDYAVTDLASWSDGFSVIRQVEYPVDDDEEIASVLQEDAWRMYQTPDGEFLRFLEDKPPATEEFRVTYTALHTCTDAAGTVKTFDDEAVQALAAGYFCEMISTYYAQLGDSSIAADSVDHTSKSRDYAARGKAWRKVYFDHLGIKEGSVAPASVTKDWDLKGSWGRDKMTHPGKYR